MYSIGDVCFRLITGRPVASDSRKKKSGCLRPSGALNYVCMRSTRRNHDSTTASSDYLARFPATLCNTTLHRRSSRDDSSPFRQLKQTDVVVRRLMPRSEHASNSFSCFISLFIALKNERDFDEIFSAEVINIQ